ncbi:uncharacterized protein [Hoplias malabaricus]|uniref:uncharacterized protein n=1 Tax=Hoplias malabaricus TaxID=27720 RepID=UPI003463072F
MGETAVQVGTCHSLALLPRLALEHGVSQAVPHASTKMAHRVKGFDNVYSILSVTQSGLIFSFIQDYLQYQSTQGNGLGCYRGGDFYIFLKRTFLSFGFPDLSTLLSLIPASRQQELLGSISPGELNEFLNSPNTVRSGSDLCTLLKNYNSTDQYLETEPVISAVLGRQTLGCFWSRVLSASSLNEVNQWFNVTLSQYLPFLSSQLISPTELSGATCLSYQKLVSVLGNSYNFSNTDFTAADVYSSIKVYLNSSDGSPHCYNSSDPLLNSTAWFSNNIGFFITFITLTDLQSFISENKISVFLENPVNIELFNTSGIASNVTTYYSTELFIQNPNYNPLSLPGVLLCGAPGSVFGFLGATESQNLLKIIRTFCGEVDPEISTALVANFPTLSTSTIQMLGNQSIGLTEGQINAASPSVINSSLPTLSTVTGWNQGQVNNIIHSITSAGFNINSSSTLLTLGTLIGGVPSATISKIASDDLLSISQNPTFINNILSAPVIIQEIYVQKIVSVNQTRVVQNVPDALAAYVPRVLLTQSRTINVSLINNKNWNQHQAVVLYGTVSRATQDTEGLSVSVLQGFTCSSVQSLPRQKITQLITACRPRPGRNKVTLKESQLTCMYQYVKDNTSLTFTDLPADLLLYYSYDQVKQNCVLYFTALGGADFSVPSSILNKQSTLFQNAQSCLGISGVALNRTQVDILGNMICTLDSSYIQNSDPLILEKLKNCGDFSDSQVSAIETLLFSGNTPYGNPSRWNLQTLKQLGLLPLYLGQDFWSQFSFSEKKMFLRSFLPFLRKMKTPVWKMRRLFRAYSTIRYRRSADCTAGVITAVTIADDLFPYSYDATQFDLCLNITVLIENLAAITEKVVDPSLQTIILDKLNQMYPLGIPESVVQLLSPTSRVANVIDIYMWNITTIETLSSLMVPDNGDWTSRQSNAVILKYLSVPGNTLGADELNTVGSYICFLNVSVLRTITTDSLLFADPLNVLSCSLDQQRVLYHIAFSSFRSMYNNSTTYYLYISTYLGGAPLEDLQALSTLNISMDIDTFMNLDPDVLIALNVTTVRGLLGVNVGDLKTFENSTAVMLWESHQSQSDLDSLDIGLQYGIKHVINSTPVSITSVVSMNSETSNTISTSAPVTSTIVNISTTANDSNPAITITANTSTSEITSTTAFNNQHLSAAVNTITAAASHNETILPTSSVSTSSIAVSEGNSTVNTTKSVHVISSNAVTTFSANSIITQSPRNGNITVINATTASFSNTTTTNSSDVTVISAGATTNTVSLMNVNIYNTSLHATAATTTASINTTMTGIIGSTFNTTHGIVEYTSMNATAVSLNTTGMIAATMTGSINSASVKETSINATTSSHNASITMTGDVNSTTASTENGNIQGTSINTNTASLNTSVSSTISAKTDITAKVNPTIANIINGNTVHTSISDTTVSLNTTATTNVSDIRDISAGVTYNAVSPVNANGQNTAINATTASDTTTTGIMNTTTVNTVNINDNVRDTSINATTASLNMTTNTSVNANSTIYANVNSTTVIATLASINTSVTSLYSASSTMNVSVNSTTLNPVHGNGNVNSTIITATTTSLNTTSTTSASAITFISAGVNTTAVNPLNGNGNTIIGNATTARANTLIPASVSTTNVSTINGNISTISINIPTENPQNSSTISSNTIITTSNTVYSKEMWTLFFQRYSVILDEALDLFSSRTTNITLSDPNVLDAIGELIVNNFTATQLTNITFITKWFQTTLRPFLSSVSINFLSILSSNNFSCQTYQVVVAEFSTLQPLLEENQKSSIYSDFIYPFLLKAHLSGQSCVQSMNNDSDWLVKNFGQFSSFASYSDFIRLKSDFNGVNASDLLTSNQLAELCSDPSQLHGAQDINTVLAAVNPNQFASFFDILTPNIQNVSLYSSDEKEAFVKAVLNRGGLSSAAVSDSEVLQWVNVRLLPFLSSLSSADVSLYFSIFSKRSCNTSQAGVKTLDSLGSAFNNDTQTQIYNNILQLLTGNGLGCYSGGNFYIFLKRTFLSFEFPDLSTFLSLIPASRQQELLGSISPGELSEFLNSPNTVRSGSDLCTLLKNYNSTDQYLETEPVISAVLGRQTLGCFWSRVLSASSLNEVNQWFNVTLSQYLPFLSSQLISPTELSGATCLSYQKLISVLGNNYNFSNTDFTAADVYSSIKVYLNSSDGTPRCYNSSDPLLNSTAWFSNNIGFFITFITLTDLQSFISENKIRVFLENPKSIELFNTSGIASNVTTFYSTELFIQNPEYNPLSLPGVLLCGAPASVFVSIGPTNSTTILGRINQFCPQISPQVTAALAANFPNISMNTIQMLGNQSIGLSEGQIIAASPAVFNSTLPILSNITGWNQGQLNNLIQSITMAGYSIDSGPSLVNLGTLIGGVPSATISQIPSTDLLSISQNPTFINNIQSAPVILQETYVQKIVSVDLDNVVKNVQDALARFIPPVILSSPAPVNVSLFNTKSWTQEQAKVLFKGVTSVSENTEELSVSILQGFTCTSVQSLPQQKIEQLITACRPRPGRSKVNLKETQLTCMYNYIKGVSSLNFTSLPFDVLLYYSYDQVSENCVSYFSALGGADFSVPSSVLNIQSTLFQNAQNCLGISGVVLNRTQVDILGNMTCTLDSSYIQNSDPLILEKLKNCGDLSDSQVSAIETLLFSGNTPYGNTSSWRLNTLNQLGILPLYLKQSFWSYFSSTTKKTFLQSFFPTLKKQNTPMEKLKRLFTQISTSSIGIQKRSLTKAECTAGNITEAVFTDPSFPFGYDVTQFNSCLENSVLKGNPSAIIQKVVDTSILQVILDKLNQIYPTVFSESLVQLLGAVSRVADLNDISKWNITTIDTLSSLMNPSNGIWTSDQSNAVIMKYLIVAGNTLGTNELNAVGSYVCSLNISVLNTITADSLMDANSLNVSSCSIDKKSVLYIIAKSSFSSVHNDSTSYYQLISPYLCGAPLADIQALSALNISMDITTFTCLNPAVITALNVSTMRDLLGVNLPDLKLFENTTQVQSWVQLQYKSALATLGIGLLGGINDPTSTTSASISTINNVNTNINNNTTIGTSSQTVATTAHGSGVVHHGSGLWFISLCVGLLTITLHTLQ